MENILLWVAYIAFILAFCSLVASVVIFVKADVPDAIRFLQHKPMKNQASNKAAAQRHKNNAERNEPKAAPAPSKRPTRSTEEVVEKADQPVEPKASASPAASNSSGTTVIGEEELPEYASALEQSTTVLTEDEPTDDIPASERATTVLASPSHHPSPSGEPASPLRRPERSGEAAKSKDLPPQPEDDAERPTTILREEDDTERPTTILDADASERPTTVLDEDAVPDDSIISRASESSEDFESTFRFSIKKKVMSINTEERI